MQRGFLVGCARSGTTLFQAMLATHSNVTSFPETHFFDRLYWGRKANTLRSLRALWVMFEVGRWVGQPAPFLVRPHLRRRDYGKDYIRLLDDAARRRGAHAWIEKTTSHALFIDKILAVAPSSPRYTRCPEATLGIGGGLAASTFAAIVGTVPYARP